MTCPTGALTAGLLRRRLAPRASRELLPPLWISAPAPKVVAGRRALSLKALILTANSPENTRKMATLPEACQCAPVFRRRYRFWRCCAWLATRYCLKLSAHLSDREGVKIVGNTSMGHVGTAHRLPEPPGAMRKSSRFANRTKKACPTQKKRDPFSHCGRS